MKNVLIICHSLRGGAGKGAQRLSCLLNETGFVTKILISENEDDFSGAILYKPPIFKNFLIKFFEKVYKGMMAISSGDNYSLNLFDSGVGRKVIGLNPDIVIFFWCGAGFISLSEIAVLCEKFRCFWKMPDQWAYSSDGRHYLSSEPKRGWIKERISRFIAFLRIHHRDRIFEHIDGVFSPSQWLIDELISEIPSFELAKVHRIDNPVDLSLFKPMESSNNEFDNMLAISQSHNRFLVIGNDIDLDPRKGLGWLKSSASQIFNQDDLVIVAGGRYVGEELVQGIKFLHVGFIHDVEQLVALYNSVSAVLVASAIDNSPNVIKEAGCCGAPSIAFDNGGISGMFEDGVSGLLIPAQSVPKFSHAVSSVRAGNIDRLKVASYFRGRHNPLKVALEYQKALLNE